MARLLTLKCPECHGTFEFLRHPSDEPLPTHCELCNADMTSEPTPVFVPHINLGKAKHKVPDKLFKDMMNASEERAKDAADLAGCSVADLPGIKITDMKDNLREGDVAAKTDPGAEGRIRREHERAAAQAGANLSHVNVNGKMIPTGHAAGQAQVTRPSRPDQMAPEVAEWVQGTRSGDAALQTRSIIEDMQISGKHSAFMAATTAKGQMAKA